MMIDVTKDVDQVEWHAIKYSSATCDSGTLDERVAGAAELADFSGPGTDENGNLSNDDIVNDSFAGLIQEKIRERGKHMGDAYPFSLDGNTLSYDNASGEHLLYEFLLLASRAWGEHPDIYNSVSRCFERIAAMVVSRYFGLYAESRHVGFPRDGGSNFADAMREVHEMTGEFSWCPEERAGDHRDVKDEGLDFIIHMRHADNRLAAQLFVLGQCACGQNWDSKLDDLNMKKLDKWFNPMSIVPPVKAFAVPHYVEEDKIVRGSREGGLIFDRARMVKIISDTQNESLIADFFANHELAGPVRAFINERRG